MDINTLKEKRQSFFLPFPLKISLIFSLFILVFSVLILFYLYSFSKSNVLLSIQSRISDIGKTGLFLFKQNHFEYIKKLAEDLDKRISLLEEGERQEIIKIPPGETYELLEEDEHDRIYYQKESQEIVQFLRIIKAGTMREPIKKEHYEIKFYPKNDQPFIRFTYIVTPVEQLPENHFVKFILDSDMEEYDINENGVIDADEESMKIGTIWNIENVPILKQVIQEKQPKCENDFYMDQWGTWLSCYILIYDYNKNFVGIMGLDLDVQSENNKLLKLKQTLYILIIVLVLGTFLISFTISKLFLKPVIQLSTASIEVSSKNFNIELPVKSRDEVGILTRNFNYMVKEIKEYSEHLEDLVRKRTKELEDTLKTVQALKEKQDGDYFLTSLLLDPLMKNLNKSKNVITEVFLRQKKEFTFKKKNHQIGGDLCITGNLRFLNSKGLIERWVFFFNGDAMGKSLQGASGSLVMSVLLNAFISRSASKDRILNINPEKWFRELCGELQYIFTKFDGSMMVSGAMGILNEYTGQLIYANFEHPFTILYRNHQATFLEETSQFLNYKFGFPEQKKLNIINTFLQVGDILILGSDGRDDIILKETQEMNKEENLILKIVEKSLADLNKIYLNLCEIGEITDDVSLLKVDFQKKAIHKLDILEDIKNLAKDEKYQDIIQRIQDIEIINDPLIYFYISLAYYKSNQFFDALKWLDPIKDLIKNDKLEKYKKKLYSVIDTMKT